MAVQSSSLLGVIEGFYGRPWSHSSRLAYANYLPLLGLNSYLYCPKSDPFLRRRWQEDWPIQVRRELEQLARAYSAAGIHWGVGLSPFALYENYDARARGLLQRKIACLADLDMPLLAILFDDMPGNLDALAQTQAQIVSDVCSWYPRARILVCPTYYSFDPVLEKFFGARPTHYWRDLGALLPPEVDIFWTGNQVCSERISGEDIDAICLQLGRPVMLWDNYPVNDGAVRSNHIYSSKLSGRAPQIRTRTTGHFCNPMNQALLSLPALAGLGEFYGNTLPADGSWLEALYGHECYRHLQTDKRDFETLGLSGLGQDRRHALAATYAGLPGEAAIEVAAWLRGEYTFDPACLTD